MTACQCKVLRSPLQYLNIYLSDIDALKLDDIQQDAAKSQGHKCNSVTIDYLVKVIMSSGKLT